MSFSVESLPRDIAPLPTKIFSAREVCELSLMLIGAYSPADQAADPIHMERALQFMELEAAHLAGTKQAQWLVPQTIEIPLDADTPAYDLSDQAGAAEPSLYIMAPISATLIDDNDNETPLNIVRRSQYEEHPNKTTSGVPNEIYIDRTNDEQGLWVYPVPEVDTFSLRLVVFTYARSVLGQLGDVEAGQVAHGFDRTWQLWLSVATAARIGSGPVRRLDRATLNDYRQEAGRLLTELMAGQNREKISLRLRRTRRYDY